MQARVIPGRHPGLAPVRYGAGPDQTLEAPMGKWQGRSVVAQHALLPNYPCVKPVGDLGTDKFAS